VLGILSAVAQDPRIGTVLAGCRIDGRLRPGGMSVVYAAEHLALERKVALKLLDQRLAQDEAYRKRFIRESRLAAGLYHPNIVPIYDAGEAEDLPYIMMHFVEGSDLAETIEKEGALDPDRVLSILTQAGAALDAAHDRELVHRDVKPANILIASGAGAEPAGHVYLTDFGLAKQVGSEFTKGITQAGVFMGTLDYVAPEQIQGRGVDRRTDVYSLGCVVYESLTGAVPFERDTEVAMMYAHMQDESPRVSQKRSGLPSAVDDVVMRAMAKKAEDRFDSCGELIDTLRKALQAEEVVTSPGTERPRIQETRVAPVPEEAPQAPPLEGVVSIDYQGSRYGLGRSHAGYAIWDLQAGGAPVYGFPLTPQSWDQAWAAYQSLEAASSSDEHAVAEAEAEAVAEEATPVEAAPQQALILGVVFLDYRGESYGLGRTADGYAIWDLRAGGAPIQQFAQDAVGWEQAWASYQTLEMGDAAASTEQPTSAGPSLDGLVAVDYTGATYALGRIANGYAIWDLRTGGPPLLTFPLSAQSWEQAWQAYQQLEQRGASSQ
jgi:serine/threonine protein kinase